MARIDEEVVQEDLYFFGASFRVLQIVEDVDHGYAHWSVELDQNYVFSSAYERVHFKREPNVLVLLGQTGAVGEILHFSEVILHGGIQEHSWRVGLDQVGVLRTLEEVDSKEIEDLDFVEANVVLVLEGLLEVEFQREPDETVGVSGSPFYGRSLTERKANFLV